MARFHGFLHLQFLIDVSSAIRGALMSVLHSLVVYIHKREDQIHRRYPVRRSFIGRCVSPSLNYQEILSLPVLDVPTGILLTRTMVLWGFHKCIVVLLVDDIVRHEVRQCKLGMLLTDARLARAWYEWTT